MKRAAFVCLLAMALDVQAARVRSVRITPTVSADCPMPPAAPETCSEGGPGYAALLPGEVDAIVRAAARSLDVETMTVAVVDRAGRVLAVFRKPAANPANDDQAIGVARTAAFFSHNQAPLSSRTVRF
ncbi:MAG TPA: heme-binding protein, partial [Thermoanaerobaculia bacterium]|nr:heme-binding protein [Thermoanaerobaculia bacterium]